MESTGVASADDGSAGHEAEPELDKAVDVGYHGAAGDESAASAHDVVGEHPAADPLQDWAHAGHAVQRVHSGDVPLHGQQGRPLRPCRQVGHLQVLRQSHLPQQILHRQRRAVIPVSAPPGRHCATPVQKPGCRSHPTVTRRTRVTPDR